LYSNHPSSPVNLLEGNTLDINGNPDVYFNQQIHSTSFAIDLNDKKVTRLSLTLDHVEGNWSLFVKNEQDQFLAKMQEI
jgi:hypothetical protein